MDPKPLGDWGERYASEYLERNGWTILERKFRAGHKEIDLVARRGEVVAFVEVKTRSAVTEFGHPFESIGRRKRHEIEAAARAWVDAYGDAFSTFRFDAIAVVGAGSEPRSVEHLEDAWGL